jgi:hypothetical protein
VEIIWDIDYVARMGRKVENCHILVRFTTFFLEMSRIAKYQVYLAGSK